MRRFLPSLLGLVFTALILPVAGCGGEETVTQSPEAKKADTAGQDAMKEFMQSKTKKPGAK